MTLAQLQAFINLWVDNDPVKAFQKYRMNKILLELTKAIDNAVAGIQTWGNIEGDINDQTDLINLINTVSVKVRNTPADLTNDGIEIVVNNGIYNNGTLILAVTSPFVIALRETAFTLISGKWTCNDTRVQAIPSNVYQVQINEYNRFIYPDGNISDANDGAHPEWELVTGGGFQINLPEFDPSTQSYHVYVYPSII